MSEKDVVENVDSPGEIGIPIANNSTPGIASFDSNDFTVGPDGKVSSIVERGIPQYLGKITGTGTGTTDLNWEVDWKSRPIVIANGEEEVDKAKRIKIGEYIMLTAHFNQFMPGDIFRITSVQIEGSTYIVKTNNVRALSLASIVGPQGKQGNEGPQGVPYLAYTNNIESTVDPVIDSIMHLEDGHFNRTPIINAGEYQDVVTVDWYNKTTHKAFMVTGIMQGRDSSIVNNPWVAQITAATDITGAEGPQGKEGAGIADIVDIDYPHGEFISVQYDTTDGIKMQGIAEYLRDDGETYQIPTDIDVPLVAGEGLSMDKKATEEKVEIKSLNSNLENGTGEGSLQQKNMFDEDGNEWPKSIAYGLGDIAFGSKNIAYQYFAYTNGRGNEVGLTEDEFNAYYWDSINNVPLHDGNGKDEQGRILNDHDEWYSVSRSYGTALGYKTQAKGRISFTYGYATKATEDSSLAGGWRTSASGKRSVALGNATTSSNENSFSIGNETVASGTNSIATGYKTIASGTEAVSTGSRTQATGNMSISAGTGSKSSGQNSIATGVNTEAAGQNSISAGNETIVKGSNSFASGYKSEANADASFAIGLIAKANGAHSASFGAQNNSNGENSFTSGKENSTRDINTSAFGWNNKANGQGSFAAGHQNQADGIASAALGVGNITTGFGEVAVGTYNDAQGTDVFSVGNGTSDTDRKSAFRALRDGRAKVQTAPIEENDVVRLKDLNTKLNKITTSSSATKRLYGVAADGTQVTYIPTAETTNNSIMSRNSRGSAEVTDPTSAYGIANKQWVEAQIAAISSSGGKLYKHAILIEGEDGTGAAAAYNGIIMSGYFYSSSNRQKTIADFWNGNFLGINRILINNPTSPAYLAYSYTVLSEESQVIGLFYIKVEGEHVVYDDNPTSVSGYTFKFTDTVTEV